MDCLSVRRADIARGLFPKVLAGLLAVATATIACGQPPAPSRVATRGSTASDMRASRDQAVTGAQLLEQVAAMIASRPAVVAKSRFQIDLFDQHLLGSGSYHEATYAQDRLLRVESKIPVAGALASFQQVSDGRYVWTRKDFPALNGPSVPTVRRIDLQRVKEQRSEPSDRDPIDYPIGGIGHLITELLVRYEFSPGRMISHQGLSAILVRGALRDSHTAADTPTANAAVPSEMPTGLIPTSVTLVIGQQDLFPFVIQYHGTQLDGVRGSAQERTGDESEPMMTIEYYEVDFPPRLDPRLFIYHAGEIAIKDDTEEYLRQRRLHDTLHAR